MLHPLKLFLVILSLYSGLLTAQNESKVLLINQKGDTVYTLKEGTLANVITLDKYQMTSKHKGILKIMNDSIISVDSLNINIDSIYKIGKLSHKRTVLGHSLTAIGSGVLITGGILFGKSINDSNVVSATSNFIVGTVLLGIGTVMTIGGQKIANGRPKRVKPYKTLKIYKLDKASSNFILDSKNLQTNIK